MKGIENIIDLIIRFFPKGNRRSSFMNFIQNSENATGTRSFRSSVTCKDGTEKFVEFNLSRINDQVILQFYDITDFMLTQRENIEITTRLNSIIDTSDEFYYSLNINGTGSPEFNWIEGNFEEITTYQPEEILDLDSWKEIIVTEDRILFEKTLVDIQNRDLKTVSVEYRIHTKGGQVKWLRDRQIRILDEERNTVISIIGAVQEITDQIRNEKELYHQATLLDSVRESVIATDIAGHISHWNKGAELLYGYKNDEAMEKPISILLTSQNEQDEDIRLKTVNTTGSWSGRILQRKNDGSSFLSETHMSVISDVHGYPQGMVMIDRDITDKLRSEEAVNEREERWRSLVRSIPNSVTIIDRDGSILLETDSTTFETSPSSNEPSSSPPADEYSFSPSESDPSTNSIAGAVSSKLSFFDSIDPEYISLLKRTIEEILDTGKPDIIEIRRIGITDTPQWQEIRISPIKRKGENVALTIITTNMTRKKQSEKALMETEERYRMIFNGSRDAVFITDRQSRFLDVNQAAVSLTGYSKDELVKMNLPDLQEVMDLSYYNDIFTRILNGESILNNSVIRTKEGELIDVEFSNQRIFIGNEAFVHTIARDISKRMEAEQKIKASLLEKEVLLKEIHHRVKNNLQVISSLLYLQSTHLDDDRVNSIIRESRNRIQSMALVHERLYKSSDLANIDFTSYIRDFTAYLFKSYNVDPRLITTTLTLDQIFLSVETAIPCGLIMHELVINALKHAFPDEENGMIQIHLSQETDSSIPTSSPAEEIQFIIEDNGIGLPDGLDIWNTESMGLHLVSTLVKQLGGHIKVDSPIQGSQQERQGTRFTVTFNKVTSMKGESIE